MKFFSLSFFSMSGLLFFASFMSLLGFMTTSALEEVSIQWTLYEAEGLCINLSFLLDMMSVLFFLTVMLISGGVFMYASSYMDMDKFSSRFSILVMSFVGSMVMLIFTSNIVTLLLGWDGLGVTSYLLVCYYCSEKSFNSSMLTALTNRIGDVAVLLYISQMMGVGLFNFSLTASTNCEALSFSMFLILVAAMTKSAQIPFSSWLPAAMAAPTPVSALVHSSTLVTAGVYLLIRHNHVLQMSGWLSTILWLGLITMVMAGSAALFELDMKKVIALSTLSQLGVMFFSLGLGLSYLSFFHLLSHAYFKAMLFMAAGAVIHSVKDYQDLRKMGTFQVSMPSLAGVMMISNLSLCGLPFMAGFYSKDVILESMMMNSVSVFVWAGAMLGTLLTVMYSCRFSLGVLGGFSKREAFSGESDSSLVMLLGMSVLVIPSVMGGWGLSGTMSSNMLIFLSAWMKLFILVMIILASGLILSVGKFNIKPAGVVSRFTHQMWFMPLLFSPEFTQRGLIYSSMSVKVSDSSWIINLSWRWALNLLSGVVYSISSFQIITMSSGVALIVFSLLQ